METSAIAKAFLKAQKGFGPALKTATNPHFRSKYVSLDGCIEAVIDSLHNNNLSLIQKTHDCEGGVKIETILLHESGETMSGGMLFVPANKHDAQGYGSALTYARRYSLLSFMGIAPEDDDGNAATKSIPKTGIKTPMPVTTSALRSKPSGDASAKKAISLSLPGKGELIFPDEYKFADGFISLIKKIDASSVEAKIKLEKADLLFKTNKVVLENRISKLKKTDIKQAMDNLFNKYRN